MVVRELKVKWRRERTVQWYARAYHYELRAQSDVTFPSLADAGEGNNVSKTNNNRILIGKMKNLQVHTDLQMVR